MPKVKSITRKMNITTKNDSSFEYKYDVNMSKKDFSFSIKVPDFLKENLDDVPEKVTGMSYAEVTASLNEIIDRYEERYSQYNNNIQKRIYWKWNYSFTNGKFSYYFDFFVASVTIIPISSDYSEGYTGYGGRHRTMTGRKHQSYVFFGDKKPKNHSMMWTFNDDVRGIATHQSEFVKHYGKYKYIKHDSNTEEKLDAFKILLDGLNGNLSDILKKIKETQNLLPITKGDTLWLS